MGILNAVRAGLEEGAKRIKAYHGSPHDSANFNPQLAGRHPSDNADMSALQLAPYMAKGLVNDVVKYGSQAVTGEISDGDFLQQQPLTGQAKTIADAAGSAMGTALNYKVPSLMRGSRSIMDDISVVADGYRKVKPSLIESLGEPAVNRAEGAGLLGSMFIPAKIPKAQSGGLFSQAVIASDKLQRKTGNADGFFNDLTGKGQVKPDELNAMGFKENFAGRQDVSRQEVQQFVGDNQLQIKETVLGKKGGDLAERAYRERDDGGYDLFDERGEWDGEVLTFDEAEEWAGLSDIIGDGAYDTSKFGDYTLDGGDNYREILLQDGSRIGGREQLQADIKEANNRVGTLKHVSRIDPSTDYFDELNQAVNNRDGILAKLDQYPKQYVNSNHFEEPDVLAHLRMKDRVDTEGNKTLLIEEAQSDLHQQGADVGYQNPKRMKELDDEYNRLDDEILKSYQQHNSMDAGRDRAYIRNTIHELELERTNIDIERGEAAMAVPDAPFKTDDKSSWYNLAMKRGLLEAVEGGYDKLALTTGRQQADRYDLSKSINEVRLGGDEQNGFTVSAFDKSNNPVIMESISSLDELPGLIGKDAAKSLIDQPLSKGSGLDEYDERRFRHLQDRVNEGEAYSVDIEELEALKLKKDAAEAPGNSPSVKILAGQDLSVGGEGMKQFYDRTLPNALGKLVKQDGVKVGQSELSSPRLKKMLSRKDQEELTRLKKEFRTPAGLSARQLDRYTELNKKNNMQVFDKDTVHSIDITPEMRERVKKGLPLFATGGAAIGLAEMMSQQPQEDQRPGLFNSLQY